MSGLRRQLTRQTDVVEWLRKHSSELKKMRAERWKLEKGFVAYGKDVLDFFSDMRSAKKERSEMTDEQKKAKALDQRNSALGQYDRSQELLRKLKWKRVTWEPECNYDEFAQRIVDEDSAFAKTRAFSFLSAKVVRDPSVAAIQSASQSVPLSTNMRDLKTGSLTKWFVEQRDKIPIPPYQKPSVARPAPISVVWESGEVRILETASPREVATFLETLAPRVQAIQQRIDKDHAQITEDIDIARRRIGAYGIKVNKNDVAFWDDEDRTKDPLYVTPAHVRSFLDGVLSRAMLLRFYLRGQHIRIVHPSQPYAFDTQKNEIRIPANFVDFCFLPVHGRYVALESWLNAFRKLTMVWFVLGAMIIGDLEII